MHKVVSYTHHDQFYAAGRRACHQLQDLLWPMAKSSSLLHGLGWEEIPKHNLLFLQVPIPLPQELNHDCHYNCPSIQILALMETIMKCSQTMVINDTTSLNSGDSSIQPQVLRIQNPVVSYIRILKNTLTKAKASWLLIS